MRECDDERQRRTSLPILESSSRRNAVYNEVAGMSLRDYFAGQALTAVKIIMLESHPAQMNIEDYTAEMSYRIADAMLKERAK